LEVQNHDIPEERAVSEVYEHYSGTLGIPIIATQDSHYLDKGDYLAHDVAICIGTGQNLVDERKFKFEGTNYHLLATDEMLPLYKPEWLSNTKLIVDKCGTDILEYDKIRLPKFVPPTPGEDPEFDAWLTEQGVM
jgi:DNA polymerase-3 subunit alpha